MNRSFRQCIANICGLELTTAAGCKYAVFDNVVAVVEGHCGIDVYSTEKVSFALRSNVLEVCGSELKIKCLEKHFAVVVGKIKSVAVNNV